MLFSTMLQQMLFLFSIIIIGYAIAKLKLLPFNSETVLANLEQYLFIPALSFKTFMNQFTIDKLQSAGQLLLISLILELIIIVVAFISTRFITKDTYMRKIYMYGLCFSNYGFMGNSVVLTCFPEYYFEYSVFTIVLGVFLYVWAMPTLLMDGGNDSNNPLKKLMNPAFVCMMLGSVVGVLEIKIPSFFHSFIDSTSSCMSPVAMLITGIAIAKIDIKSVLKSKSIYLLSFLRLIVFPLGFIALWKVLQIDLSESFLICAVASLAMPLGLNSVVIPSAYGKDTSIASGMALVSHAASIITIPFIFSLIS